MFSSDLDMDRMARLPDEKIANAITEYKRQTGEPLEIAIPHPLATHTTILYKYLKAHGKRFDFRGYEGSDVTFKIVKPPKSPIYIKKKAARSLPAAFEQSLPWAEVVETDGNGYVG